MLAYGDGINLSFLLTVRLLTRTVKLARYFHGWRRLGLAFRLKTGQLVTAVAGLLAVHTIAASLMYFAESKAQPDVFSSIPAAMWWSVVTLTTVGYGDAVPVTDAGRALAAVIAVLGIGLFALPAGILSAGLWEADLAAAPPPPRPRRFRFRSRRRPGRQRELLPPLRTAAARKRRWLTENGCLPPLRATACPTTRKGGQGG